MAVDASDIAKPAKYKPPAKACDCHSHVVGPFDKFPLKTEHPMGARTLEAYLRMHEIIGIERGVLTQLSYYGLDNSCLLDALARTNGTLKGIVAMDPATVTPSEIARLDKLGVRGLRIRRQPGVEPPHFDTLEDVGNRLRGTGWHIEIVPPDTIDTLVELRPRLEKLGIPVVFDQMACPDLSRGVDHPSFQAIVSMIREGWLWVKLSHPYHLSKFPYDAVLPFAQALVSANSRRCVWATDWPHPWARAKNPPVPDDGFLLDLLTTWVPDEATRERILIDNPAELYRF